MVDISGERDPERDAAEMEDDPERIDQPTPVAPIIGAPPPSGGPQTAAIPSAFVPDREDVLRSSDDEAAAEAGDEDDLGDRQDDWGSATIERPPSEDAERR
jgi:hypothetical protein